MFKAILDWLDWCFVPRDFVCISVDGSGCTMTPADACETIASFDEDVEFVVTPVRMTACAFEALEEFYGW